MTLFTVKEAAEFLKCSQSFLRARVADGSLKHYRLGNGQGGIRISGEQIEDYLKGREMGGQRRHERPTLAKPRHLKNLSID